MRKNRNLVFVVIPLLFLIISCQDVVVGAILESPLHISSHQNIASVRAIHELPLQTSFKHLSQPRISLLNFTKPLTVAVLDVGEGLCVVVRSPVGKTLVMDCGTSSWRQDDKVGEKITAQYLQSMGVDAIDVAVLSHPHSDHVSGYAGLLKLKPARTVLDISIPHPNAQYKRFLKTVKSIRADYKTAKRGQRILLGGGVQVFVLNPAPGQFYSDLNDNSIVLKIVYKSTSFLLAGDAGGETESDILSAGIKVKSQVLVVGHHGSNTASSIEWLKAIKPAVAVISCGKRNIYRHPSPKVLKRLKSIGSKIFRTDKDGAIILSSDGKVIRAKTFAVRQKKY